MRRFAIVGNPDNRRVVDFAAAVLEAGLPEPLVVAHADLLAALEADGDGALEPLAAITDEELVVRVDSPGEDVEVERALLRLGYSAAGEVWPRADAISPSELARTPVAHGQVLAPRQHHLGFERYLSALGDSFAARPGWRVLNPVADIALLFDKRALASRYAELGLPVPPALPDYETIVDGEQLRAAMAAARWPAVYVKVSCASSASCLALYRHLPGRDDGDVLITTLVETDRGRFNALRPRRVAARPAIDATLAWLLGEGCRIERALPKARVDGRRVDLRVLVVDGEARFVVLRQSRHPFTNLHLGGERGDVAAFRRWIGERAWARAMASCERAFSAHDSLHLGVDVLVEPPGRAGEHGPAHAILEANAFGDLLPGLRCEGRSVYAWEIARAITDG